VETLRGPQPARGGREAGLPVGGDVEQHLAQAAVVVLELVPDEAAIGQGEAPPPPAGDAVAVQGAAGVVAIVVQRALDVQGPAADVELGAPAGAGEAGGPGVRLVGAVVLRRHHLGPARFDDAGQALVASGDRAVEAHPKLHLPVGDRANPQVGAADVEVAA